MHVLKEVNIIARFMDYVQNDKLKFEYVHKTSTGLHSVQPGSATSRTSCSC